MHTTQIPNVHFLKAGIQCTNCTCQCILKGGGLLLCYKCSCQVHLVICIAFVLQILSAGTPKTVLHKLIPMCQTNQFYDTKECNHCNLTFAYHFSGAPAQSHDTQRFSSMLEIRVHALIIPRQHHQSRVACLSFRGNMPK